MKQKILALAIAVSTVAVTGMSVAWAAVSADEAEQIVLREYPDAQIYRVEWDDDDGRAVYEVKFHTKEIGHGEITIDRETGKILERDIEY